MSSVNKSVWTGLFCYMLLLAAHIGLVWWLPYFPTQDGPSHIYNLVILRDLLNGGKEWGWFFTYQLHAVPNLGFHLLAYPLLTLFSPLVVEKLFLSTYIVLMGISVPLFLRTFDRPAFPLAYFVFPIIFNFTLLMGFYSYVIGIPLFLLAFSLAWKIRSSSMALKFVSFNLIGFTLFYVHLIPFIFFLLSLTATALVAENGRFKSKIIALMKLLFIISPSLVNLFLYLWKGMKGSPLDFSYLLSLGRYIDLLRALFFFSTANFSALEKIPVAIFVYLILFVGYLSAKDIYRRWRTGDIQASEKTLIWLASFLTLIYLYAPSRFGDGAYFNERFPWVILLITLPLMRIPETIFQKRFVSIVIAGVATLFFAFNTVILWQQSAKVEIFLKGLEAGLPKGAFVMTYQRKVDDTSHVDVLMHAASYYGIFGGCVDIGNYEAYRNYFPVRFNNARPAIPSSDEVNYESGSINWSDYPSIRYLLGWEIDSNDREKLGKFFHLIWQEEPLSIWQRNAA